MLEQNHGDVLQTHFKWGQCPKKRSDKPTGPAFPTVPNPPALGFEWMAWVTRGSPKEFWHGAIEFILGLFLDRASHEPLARMGFYWFSELGSAK